METWLYLALRDTWGEEPCFTRTGIAMAQNKLLFSQHSTTLPIYCLWKAKKPNKQSNTRDEEDTLIQDAIVFSFRFGMKQKHV